VLLLAGWAIVTALSPRLRLRCQRIDTHSCRPGDSRNDARKACQDDDPDKVVTEGIKLYYRRSLSMSV
jgi:hypothetical protein